MKVNELMTSDPAYATVNTSLHEVAQMMLEQDCGCIPVLETEERKNLIGMITDRDITIRTVAHNKNPLNMIVGEVMTDSVISVSPEMSIDECCKTMEKNQVRRVPVVDDAGVLQGILAQADIARKATPAETAELVKDISISTRTASA
ncbi:MAG: CBS domain-containing protein [Pyrinomonadaceae bacterium]|nr:CBS domain-containing protein [Pyrinomonadaceae bacterium]